MAKYRQKHRFLKYRKIVPLILLHLFMIPYVISMVIKIWTIPGLEQFVRKRILYAQGVITINVSIAAFLPLWNPSRNKGGPIESYRPKKSTRVYLAIASILKIYCRLAVQVTFVILSLKFNWCLITVDVNPAFNQCFTAAAKIKVMQLHNTQKLAACPQDDYTRISNFLFANIKKRLNPIWIS